MYNRILNEPFDVQVVGQDRLEKIIESRFWYECSKEGIGCVSEAKTFKFTHSVGHGSIYRF